MRRPPDAVAEPGLENESRQPSPQPATDPRASLLVDIFSRLSVAQVEYAVLHGGSTGPPKLSSDVDIMLGANPTRVVDPILEEMQGNGRLTILQRLHYEIPHGYYYVLALHTQEPLFLHLDCLFDPIGVNRYHLTSCELLRERVEESWGIRTSNENTALYLLIKRAIKR